MKSLSFSILFICSVFFLMSCAKKESNTESATTHCSISYTCGYSETTNALSGITYGNSTFVTVGRNGNILTSTDGSTWTARTSGTLETLKGVVYGNSSFVYLGQI